jgi:RND family efflux transporter MFP subunit
MSSSSQGKGRPWLLIGIGVLVAGFAINIGAGKFAQARDASQPVQKETLPLVEAATARKVPQTYTITEEGFLRPRAEIDVVSEIAGKVVEVAPQLEPGGRFREGEVLFRIETRTIEADLERAKADEAAALSELRRARAEEARQQRLQEIGAAATARLEQAQANTASAEARLGQARAALTTAEKRLDDGEVTAPFDAAVISENVSLGRFLQPGTVAATIFDTGAAQIIVGLLPDEAAAVRRAAAVSDGPLEVDVTPSAASATSRVLKGQVKRFGSAIDRQSRTVPLVVEVPNAFSDEPGMQVLANDFVTVDIPARAENALYSAPAGVIREERYVWVLDRANRLRRVEVTPVERGPRNVVFRTQEDLDGRSIVLTALTEEADGLQVEVQAAGETRAALR